MTIMDGDSSLWKQPVFTYVFFLLVCVSMFVCKHAHTYICIYEWLQ